MKRFLALAAAITTCTAFAQTYPAKPLRIIVPYPPGGGTDLAARLVAQKLTDSLGKSEIGRAHV